MNAGASWDAWQGLANISHATVIDGPAVAGLAEGGGDSDGGLSFPLESIGDAPVAAVLLAR